VRDEKDFFSQIPSPRVNRDMVNLAAHILQTKAMKFDPRKFKDEYETALQKLVRARPRATPSKHRRSMRSATTSSI
jgi:DNA end-binding protein Ku